MKRIPVATALLVLAILLAYRLEIAAGGHAVCAAWGFRPAHPTVATALAAMWLHDPDSLAHVVGNVAALAVFGALVEREVGAYRLAFVYLLAGLGGALMHVVVDPTAATPMVGASGAIFGLMPLAVAARPRLVGFVAAYAGYNVACLLMGAEGGVALGAHVGGFAVGTLFTLVARTRGGCLAVA